MYVQIEIKLIWCRSDIIWRFFCSDKLDFSHLDRHGL